VPDHRSDGIDLDELLRSVREVADGIVEKRWRRTTQDVGREPRRSRFVSRSAGSWYCGVMAEIKIDRAPFLTRWAAVVARQLGYDEAEALTLRRAVAGLTAQFKGRGLGISTPSSQESRLSPQAPTVAIASRFSWARALPIGELDRARGCEALSQLGVRGGER
jgi:hypothetical protein